MIGTERVMPKFSLQLLNIFRRSDALQRLANDEVWLRQVVKDDPRKIIPVAEVARWLGVSNRQFWNWIEQGWISTYKRPSESYKKGINRITLLRFFTCLKKYLVRASRCFDAPPPKGGRPAKAQEKIRQAYRQGLLKGGMTPVEAAAKAGVSTESVLRAMRSGVIRAKPRTWHRMVVKRRW